MILFIYTILTINSTGKVLSGAPGTMIAAKDYLHKQLDPKHILLVEWSSWCIFTSCAYKAGFPRGIAYYNEFLKAFSMVSELIIRQRGRRDSKVDWVVKKQVNPLAYGKERSYSLYLIKAVHLVVSEVIQNR